MVYCSLYGVRPRKVMCATPLESSAETEMCSHFNILICSDRCMYTRSEEVVLISLTIKQLVQLNSRLKQEMTEGKSTTLDRTVGTLCHTLLI